MCIGKVKWWDDRRGFGFIVGNTGQDLFVHHTAINGEGRKTLVQGEDVSFDVISSEKGAKAVNVSKK